MKTFKNRFDNLDLMIGSLIAVAGVVVLVGAAVAATAVLDTSDGQRSGTLTKFSYGGAFYKSYEGELIMGGVRTVSDGKHGDKAVANVWEFSCSNPTVANKLETLVGQAVTIRYHRKFTVFVRNTSYDVVSVEPAK